MKTVILTLALALPLAARSADVPTSYTVNDTALKAPVAGTSLTFTLYSDAGCTQQVHQQAVPIENVSLVSRLKVFTAKNAMKEPNTTELRETLMGVPPSAAFYLKQGCRRWAATRPRRTKPPGPAGPGGFCSPRPNRAALA